MRVGTKEESTRQVSDPREQVGERALLARRPCAARVRRARLNKKSWADKRAEIRTRLHERLKYERGVRVRTAVRVVDPAHKLFGHSGFVVRVDRRWGRGAFTWISFCTVLVQY